MSDTFDKPKGSIAGFGDRFEKAVQECPAKTEDRTIECMESLAEWVITGLTVRGSKKPKRDFAYIQSNMGLE